MIGGIPEDGHPGQAGDGLREQLQLFPDQIGAEGGQPGDVPARTREAGYEPTAHRIGMIQHDNGDRRTGVLSRKGPWPGPRGQDDVNLQTNQVGGQVWKPFLSPLRKPVLDYEVPALDPAKVGESVLQFVEPLPY